ncbi:MAG: VOC family protein [Rhodospirillaceae bacterium]|jgi:hypothetical protein|nr:VOC family protein [Rhodospirillaceae bacterium]MBT4588178.1 VOC family protein [Rhodospirillaceae bacterium]MBT5940494.1 VOC family protein [Rhodospirillaceae bacterium]MBT7267001.1 VOC family protein [Rhodospirillaceae bacterium]
MGKAPSQVQYLKAEQPLNRPQAIAGGTFVSTDLTRTQKLLEDFAGLECVKMANGKLAVRDGGPNGKGHPVGGNYWAFEVSEVAEIEHPQHVLNHWGFDLATPEEVDAANKAALEMAPDYGIDKVQQPRDIHGVYAFYFKDFDENWWEFQYRKPNPGESAK